MSISLDSDLPPSSQSNLEMEPPQKNLAKDQEQFFNLGLLLVSSISLNGIMSVQGRQANLEEDVPAQS